MKRTTLKWLESKNACEPGVDYYKTLNTTNTAEILHRCAEDGQFSHGIWLVRRVLKRKELIQFAVFAAEQVIDIYEKRNPGDNRPRAAIEAAKAVIKRDSEANKKKARTAAAAAAAAADAAYAAYAAYAYAAAAAAADAAAAAAADAADAAAAAYAAYAADAAAAADADAAYAAYADAAYADAAAAAATYAARKEIKQRCLKYAAQLVEERK